MPNKHNGRGPRPTSCSTETAAAEGELSHARRPPTGSLREAGDEALGLDGPASTDVPLKMKFRRRDLVEHDVLGLRQRVFTDDDHYTLLELARFLRRNPHDLAQLGKKLRLLRKLPGDRRYRPLTRAQAKALIQAARASKT